MILYSFRRCPYAMRARLALLVSGARFELREVVLRAKPAALIAASSKATVPVLVTADGRVIDQSIDIMRFALAASDPEDWLAGDDRDLIALFDDRFKYWLDRYKYPERHDADPVDARAAGLGLLLMLEAQLAEQANLRRETRTLTDVAIFPFVRQFAAVDRDWFEAQPIPLVQGWLARHVESPLFLAAMTRLTPWSPGDPPVIWPDALD
jgi:glutathione S-transferase